MVKEHQKNLAVLLLAHNEGDNILSLLEEIAQYLLHLPLNPTLIVIDNYSDDDTNMIVRGNIALMKERYPFLNVRIVSLDDEDNNISPYIRGMREAFLVNANYIVQMKADLSHQPKYIPILIDNAADSDLVVASRYMRGSKTENQKRMKKIKDKTVNMLIKAFLGFKFNDITSGFKLFNADTLKNLELASIHSRDDSFNVEMNYLLTKNGCKVKEIPIIFPASKEHQDSSSLWNLLKTSYRLRFRKLILSK